LDVEERADVWNRIGEEGWPSLISLECTSLKFLSHGMKRWVQTDMAQRLESLIIPADLEMPLLGEDEVLAALQPLVEGGMRNLNRLELNEISLEEKALEVLANHWRLENVVYLGLRQNECTDAVVGVLCAHEAFESLDVLDLRANLRLSSEAVDELRDSERFRSCEVLWVDVTADGTKGRGFGGRG
jgi:hypothetical protein